jgi:hypothetical protein
VVKRLILAGFVLVGAALASGPGGGVAAAGLPAGWTQEDIGAVGRAGSATYDATTAAFTVAGAGADVWGTADALHLAEQPLTGDGSIVARVVSIQNVAPWTKAGVMMRDTLAAGSPQAFMLVSASKGTAFQRRALANGTSVSTSGGAATTAPYWVRLDRSGSVFTAFESADGSSWTTVGSQTIAMGATIHAGLGVSSHTTSATATAVFDHVTITPASSTQGQETIVIFRHGEKPAAGLGQLTCQGLNRALALPSVLIPRYGTPAAIFVPNPSVKIPDPGGSFDYVRPLATIEPTAISAGLPVDTTYGYTDIQSLETALVGAQYANSTVFVVWEHTELQPLAQDLVDKYGGGATVPAWVTGDFDSLYVVRLTIGGGVKSAAFQHDLEGLNNLSTSCPAS